VPVVLVVALVASARAATDDPIVVTVDSPFLPSGCTPRETAQLLSRLADAVNAADERALDRLFAIEDPPGRHANERPEPFFRWYSVNTDVMYDRAELFPYFAHRHRHNESWKLIGVDVGTSWVRGGAGIGYVLHRSADDLPPHATEFARGKGEIDCAAQRIYVWSMGQGDRRQGDDGLPSCPRPPGWTPGTAVIACARSAKDTNAAGLTPRAFAPDFRIVEGAAGFPRRCSPTFASGKLRSALTAFNGGLEKPFANHFVPRRAYFHPYTVDEQDFVGRASIARVARRRHAARDGWTATTLFAPQQSDGRRAIYRLDFLVSSPGKLLTPASAKVVFHCGTGLVQSWVGPALASP
jgi:hypothetical protein